MVPPDSDGISRAPPYSGTRSGGWSVFVYRAITFFGQPFLNCSTNRHFCNSHMALPYNPEVQELRFRLFSVRSPLLGESRLISLPQGTEMFHFPWFPPTAYVFSRRRLGIPPSRFPHSEIPGSMPACGFPRLIAACHVLHRLPAPRHPPCALSSLTAFFFPARIQWTRRKKPLALVPI